MMVKSEEFNTCQNEEDKKDKIKKIRKRTKALLKNVKNQMEFYFSDSNLQKDRFIKQEMDKNTDKYVPIEMFLKFNKIKTMTEDISIITKSVDKSKKLQLNEDKTQVKRIQPFIQRDVHEIDSRTVYVECLPRNVNHEWMKTVFSECGVINYVSLPIYKSTGDPKGFGFVEFDCVQSATKACELLNNPPMELGTRAGRFPKSNRQLEQLKKHGVVELEEMATETEHVPDKREITPVKQRKRRQRNTSESSIDGSDVSVSKRQKKDETIIEETKSKSLDVSLRSDEEGSAKKKKKKKKKSRKSQDVKTDEESEVTDSGNVSCLDNNIKTDLKGSKRSDKSEIKSDNNSNIGAGIESTKSKKRKLQSDEPVKSESVSDTGDVSPQKKHRKAEGSVDSSECDIAENKVRKKTSEASVEISGLVDQAEFEMKVTTDTKSVSKKKKRRRKKKKDVMEAETLHLRVIPKSEWLSLRKQYLNTQKSNMSELKKKLISQQKENNPDAKLKGDKHIEFVPDTIVKVESRSPLDKKTIRELFAAHDVNIAYVDVTDGNTSGFIRCKDSSSAKAVVNSNLEFYRFCLLQGDDENKYWMKLKLDRENKFNTKTKAKKRGLEKLVDKAQKINIKRVDKQHVFFED